MTISRPARIVLRILFLLGLLFIYIPLGVVVINSFNADQTFSWPPQEWTTEWWQKMVENQGVRDALVSSIIVGLIATAIAMVLGTLVALALGRYSFFGRDTVSLLIILPIALPGIVTGIALNNVFTSYMGGLTFLSILIGHATFCIVVVYNNAIARLRRVGTSFDEASMDLGATSWTTFRLVTFPQIRSSLVAGAVLAFGLSFDEIIVTTFTAPPNIQTLPIWIFNNLFRPNQAPIVNAVAAALVLISIVPVYLAQRLSGNAAHAGGRI
jgi:putative spermidine/putrescine transport system permease protein